MKRNISDETIETIITFLRNRNEIRKYLEMMKDKIRKIEKNKWKKKIWNLVDDIKRKRKHYENEQIKRLKKLMKLILYFAKKNHWMMDQMRKTIINPRDDRREIVDLKMIIAEENDLVHKWYIR